MRTISSQGLHSKSARLSFARERILLAMFTCLLTVFFAAPSMFGLSEGGLINAFASENPDGLTSIAVSAKAPAAFEMAAPAASEGIAAKTAVAFELLAGGISSSDIAIMPLEAADPPESPSRGWENVWDIVGDLMQDAEYLDFVGAESTNNHIELDYLYWDEDEKILYFLFWADHKNGHLSSVKIDGAHDATKAWDNYGSNNAPYYSVWVLDEYTGGLPETIGLHAQGANDGVGFSVRWGGSTDRPPLEPVKAYVSVEKEGAHDGDGVFRVDDTITWTITVENTGHNPFSKVILTDEIDGGTWSHEGGLDPKDFSLAYGATEVFTYTTVITADDVAAKVVDNIVHVAAYGTTPENDFDYDALDTAEASVASEEASYEVTYEVTGDAPATFSPSPLPEPESYQEGETVTVAADLISTEVTNSDGVKGTWVFNGWETEDATVEDGEFEMPENDVAFVGTWVFTPAIDPEEADVAAYTIAYYDEETGELLETITEETDVVGANAEAEIKTFPGYTFNADNPNNILSGSVAEDGSLELKLYYTPDEGDDPVDPGDEGDDPVDPGDEGDDPVDPGDEGDDPVDPGDEGDDPVDPGDEGDDPVDPGDEGDDPVDPGDEGDDPVDPGDEGDDPVEGDEGDDPVDPGDEGDDPVEGDDPIDGEEEPADGDKPADKEPGDAADADGDEEAAAPSKTPKTGDSGLSSTMALLLGMASLMLMAMSLLQRRSNVYGRALHARTR